MKTQESKAFSGNKRAWIGLLVLIPAAALVVIAGVSVGSVGIGFFDTARIVFSRLFGAELSDVPATSVSIILELRLPRVLLAFLTGVSMSVGGVVTQSVLHNPLASPYTLGVSSGASVGAAVVTVFGMTVPFVRQMSLAAVGTLFGVLTVIVCVGMCARVDRNMSSTTIVLLGMVLSLFLSAVFTLVASVSRDKMTVLMRWQMGSFGSKGWEPVAVLLCVSAACFLVILCFNRELDILSFSDESALSIGVNVRKTKWLLLILTAVMTSTAVSFAGVIGFVDLISPHVARKLFSPKHCFLLPISGLIGGSFMVAADLAARTITAPAELPVGAVTALIGAPFFAYLYFTKRGASKSA